MFVRSAFGVFVLSAAAASIAADTAYAFEGGIGGLGKTRPETGVVFWNDESVPLQNTAGTVSAEL